MEERSSLNVQLDHVLVLQHVLPADRLSVENARPPDAGRLQLLGKIAVHQSSEVGDRTADRADERGGLVRGLTGQFRVNADDVQELVNRSPKLFEARPVLRGDDV